MTQKVPGESFERPKIKSVFDFTAEALQQLAFYLSQEIQVPRGQVIGFADTAPWMTDVDVFPTAVTQTNWNTLTVNTAAIYNGTKSSSGAQNAQIGWDIVLGAGTWSCELGYTTTSDSGIYTVSLDGTSIGTVDAYSAATTYNVRSQITGIQVGSAAKKRLLLKMATKNGSSSSYFGFLQHVRFTRTS